MELLSIRRYASRRGCHPSYIGRLTKSGRIPLTKGKIDPAVADSILDQTRPRITPITQRTQPPAANRPADGKPSPRDVYETARAVREQFLAKQTKLDYESASGKTVDTDKVLESSEKAFSNVRVRLRGLARGMAPILAVNTHPAEIERMLLDAIDGALEGLSLDLFKGVEK